MREAWAVRAISAFEGGLIIVVVSVGVGVELGCELGRFVIAVLGVVVDVGSGVVE